MKKNAKIIFYIFIFFTAFIGFLYYLNPITLPSIQTTETTMDSMTDMLPQCPNLLRQEGTSVVLYDLNQPGSSTNPAIFTSLDEYSQFVKEQEAKGIKCPVLDLQKGVVGSSLSDAPIVPPISTDLEGKKIFNQGGYPPFDPFNDVIYGRLNENMENAEDGMSDNPMDTNWGGVQYSAQTLASGKYDGDRVTKPLYYNMRQGGVMMVPCDPGFENPPPNFVPKDLLGADIQTQHSKN